MQGIGCQQTNPFPLELAGHTTGRVNTLRPRQSGRLFADDTLKCIFLNENVWVLIKISLKFVPRGPINNILALVQIMAWHRTGDKPLSEAMMVRLATHICVTRPQWVNSYQCIFPKPQTRPFLFKRCSPIGFIDHSGTCTHSSSTGNHTCPLYRLRNQML